MGIKHTIRNPNFFDIDEIFHEYIISHNKKFEIYLVNYDIKLVFDKDFIPHIKSELQNNV